MRFLVLPKRSLIFIARTRLCSQGGEEIVRLVGERTFIKKLNVRANLLHRFLFPLRSTSVCEQRSITLVLGGRKSPIRKFNQAATNSETQGAEGGRGFLKGEWRNDSGFKFSNRGALLPNHQPSPP